MMDEFMKSLSDEQKALFIAALQSSMQPKDDVEGTTTTPPNIKEELDTPQPAPRAADDFTMRPPQRSGAVRATGTNLFTDDGSCRGGDNTTPEYTPTTRSRKPPKYADVRCSVCGKGFRKLQSLISGEYHRCDRCCGGR